MATYFMLKIYQLIKTEEITMKDYYCKLFKDYRRVGRYSMSRLFYDREGLLDTIEFLLKEFDNGNEFAIEDYFDDNKHPKRCAQLILIDFNNYLKNHGHKLLDLGDLESVKYYSTDIERRFALLKEIHEPISVEKAGEHLKIRRKTASSYINDFEKGFEFLDGITKVKIIRSHRKDFCRSTAHPLFMVLNSTELNNLMTYLDKSDNCSIRRIGSLIYSQMSEYAKNYICPNIKDKFDSDVFGYADEYEQLNFLGYVEKCGSRSEDVVFSFVYWDDDGVRHVSKGSITGIERDDKRNRIVTIKTINGDLLRLYEDEFVVDKKSVYR